MNELRTALTRRGPCSARRRETRIAVGVLSIAHAATALSIAQPPTWQPVEQPAPLPLLHFSLEPSPVTAEAPPSDPPPDPGALRFTPEPIIAPGQAPPDEARNPLLALIDQMLVRTREAEPSRPEETTPDPESLNIPEGFTLRFENELRRKSLWARSDNAQTGFNRWELLPALYLRSGRVYDAGYESIDYADLYAELGVDLTNNTGLWLRYERLRQALGQQREGEQVGADALFLQFELRF
jgi:hypothetical protein